MSKYSIVESVVHGRQAYTLDNGLLQVSALRGGGHLVDLRLSTSDIRLAISPLYVPLYPTIEPYLYHSEDHARRFGNGAGARLTASYMGHMLCFPSFGPPTQAEIKYGFTVHGEALSAPWKEYQPPHLDPSKMKLFYGADLPEVQYRIERTVTLFANETIVHVEEWIENLAFFDRPFNRNQHPTFGPPFVSPGKTMLDFPGTRGITTNRNAGGTLPKEYEFDWPHVTQPDGISVSLRPFQSMPRSTTYYPVLLNPTRPLSYFTLYNQELPLLVGYLFPTSDNPWIIDWQENRSILGEPHKGQMVARGIEFGTSPFDEGLRKSVERKSFFGTPTFQWIGARERLKSKFTIFLTEIPIGFCGVQDILLEPDQIIVLEQKTGCKFVISSSSF